MRGAWLGPAGGGGLHLVCVCLPGMAVPHASEGSPHSWWLPHDAPCSPPGRTSWPYTEVCMCRPACQARCPPAAIPPACRTSIPPQHTAPAYCPSIAYCPSTACWLDLLPASRPLTDGALHLTTTPYHTLPYPTTPYLALPSMSPMPPWHPQPPVQATAMACCLGWLGGLLGGSMPRHGAASWPASSRHGRGGMQGRATARALI